MKNRERRKYFFIFSFAIAATLYISVTLSDFYRDIEERVYGKQIDTMKEISMQGSAVVEKKLEGLINTLYGLSEYLQEEDIAAAGNIDRLAEFVQKKGVGFQRIGVADEEGNAKVTNGEKLNISDREYFQVCMREKRGVSEIRQSELVDKPVCIIAVPILRKDGSSMGIIYGIVEIGVFNIYDNTILENEEQYIQVIDMDGTYILKEASSLIGKRDNIFDGINSVESQKSAREIWEQIHNEQQVYTELTDGNSHEIAYFTPLFLNDWCVVTVIDYSEVTRVVDYILDKDVYIMIAKIVCVLFMLFMLITYFSWQERKQMRAYNERLMLDEKIMQIAAEKTGFVIMSYEIRTRCLRFISNTLMDMEFPKKIDNAPETFTQYFPLDKEQKTQIHQIFIRMETERGKREIPLCFERNGKKIYLRLQLTTLDDENGGIRQCIGVLEDGTEAAQLKEKADRDPLTGLYNRGGATEQIEKCLKYAEPKAGTVHACMIMDIDNFKTLNDTLGHQMGDQALIDVADIAKHHFRDYDIVCRMGGDEFLVFMKNIPTGVIRRNVSSLLKKLNRTYTQNGVSVTITVSAGIALMPDAPPIFSEMYRRADEALYQVKKESKNNFRIYGQ